MEHVAEAQDTESVPPEERVLGLDADVDVCMRMESIWPAVFPWGVREVTRWVSPLPASRLPGSRKATEAMNPVPQNRSSPSDVNETGGSLSSPAPSLDEAEATEISGDSEEAARSPIRFELASNGASAVSSTSRAEGMGAIASF